MKHHTKLLTIVLLLFSLSVNSQTYVHGGIYSNATWTKANSPYVVDSFLRVFQGVILTIEPGVTVKFNDGIGMVINGFLIALGTPYDSITFTSNSNSPYAGVWSGIEYGVDTTISRTVTLDYCNFQYADPPIRISCPQPSSIFIKHSSFSYNYYGYYGTANFDSCNFYNNHGGIRDYYGNATHCLFINNSGRGVQVYAANFFDCIFINDLTALEYLGSEPYNSIKNCTFCNNRGVAIEGWDRCPDTLINNSFSNNHVGMTGHASRFKDNIFMNNDTALSIGIGPSDSITGNKIFHNKNGLIYGGGATSSNFINNYICNNTHYNLIYSSTTNGAFPPICWCDTDSAYIRSKIYDGYIDISLGLLKFNSYTNCDSTAIVGLSVDCSNNIITETEPIGFSASDNSLIVFPNPTSDNLNIILANNILVADLRIYNIFGELKFASTTKRQTNVNVSSLVSGLYFVEIRVGNKILRQKFIKEKNIR